MAGQNTLTLCLWFDMQAEEAATFYTSVFDDSFLGSVSRYGPDGPQPEGTAMTVEFTLRGQQVVALNGGPQHCFTEAASLQVPCADQGEVDHFWGALSEGGQEGPCGWLKDRFGFSWQIIPTALPELLGDPDPARAQRAFAAMMQMGKLDIAALRRAADGT